MQTQPQAIQIRNLLINPPLLLAPMAGLTHSALRRIMIDFGGVGLLSTEMLSVKSVPTENPRISPYLIRTERESPLSYQLLTSTDEEIGRAIDALHAFKADAVDLNMGCPSTSVGRFGAGVMLMERPDEARRIVAEARKRTALPLSAKIRLGSDADSGKLKTFCSMLEGEGVDMLTVHARFKHEPFARNPRWEYIAEIKECIKIPVIANGGIFSVEDAEEMSESIRGRRIDARAWGGDKTLALLRDCRDCIRRRYPEADGFAARCLHGLYRSFEHGLSPHIPIGQAEGIYPLLLQEL